jgi:tRNA-2-methylthio-N6-dimethylallyladenosine synthase
MNEHDSAKMSMLLCGAGYTSTDAAKEADVVLFNTCTIRDKSHHKAISEVGKALKRKRSKPATIVGIAGCVAQEERDNLPTLFPALDIVLGPDQIHRLPDMVNKVVERQCAGIPKLAEATELINNHNDYNFVSLTQESPQADPAAKEKVSQYITIMKGCNNFCTFCIVPYVRGREVSRSPEETIAEVNELNRRGVKEITLLGQNVNSYGLDKESFGNFPKLLERISDETEIERIRYTSPHPKDLSNELIRQHKTNRLLCEHIHLPVQSGSTNVLDRMNRSYSREDYISKVNLLRKEVPGITISTDIIVGFPGETEEEFFETLDLMKSVQFDGMFAFKYSERTGTKAARTFRDDLPEKLKLDRLSQVLELNEKIVLQKNDKYVGTIHQVLVEGTSRRGNGQLSGRTRTNKIVNIEICNDNLIGELLDIKITWAGPNSLKGVAVC